MSAWTELTLLEQLRKKGCPDIGPLKQVAADTIEELAICLNLVLNAPNAMKSAEWGRLYKRCSKVLLNIGAKDEQDKSNA